MKKIKILLLCVFYIFKTYIILETTSKIFQFPKIGLKTKSQKRYAFFVCLIKVEDKLYTVSEDFTNFNIVLRYLSSVIYILTFIIFYTCIVLCGYFTFKF